MFSQFAKSFALRQKMLNFLQNLEYYMTFEVLEPNWAEMIAKIKSGKVENVDQVNTNTILMKYESEKMECLYICYLYKVFFKLVFPFRGFYSHYK